MSMYFFLSKNMGRFSTKIIQLLFFFSSFAPLYSMGYILQVAYAT